MGVEEGVSVVGGDGEGAEAETRRLGVKLFQLARLSVVKATNSLRLLLMEFRRFLFHLLLQQCPSKRHLVKGRKRRRGIKKMHDE